MPFTGERVVPGEVAPALWSEHMARYAFAAQFSANARTLDVGCGTGYGSAHLAQRSQRVFAVDVSSEALTYASAHFPVANLTFLQGNATALPIASKQVGLLTAFEIIEHIDHWADAIAECARVLRDDGLALISTPNRHYYTASRGTAGPNPYHVHEFEFAEFRTALQCHFRHVMVLLQNRAECVALYPHRIYPSASACLDATAGSENESHFFVALCSQIPDRVAPTSFVYVDRASNVLREREKHIVSLERQLDTEIRRGEAELREAQSKAQREIDRLEGERAAMAAAYEQHTREMEAEIAAKADWALKAVQELSEAVRILHETESTLEERTRWALDLQARLEHAESLVAAARTSRWLRLGRAAGVGPDLSK